MIGTVIIMVARTGMLVFFFHGKTTLIVPLSWKSPSLFWDELSKVWEGIVFGSSGSQL
jgi:hypothetical protein